MYWRNTTISNGAFAKSTAGMTYGVGGLAALITIIVGFTVMAPTTAKLGRLGNEIAAKGGPPSGEQAATMQALQARLGMGTRIGATCLAVTVITMAIARYL